MAAAASLAPGPPDLAAEAAPSAPGRAGLAAEGTAEGAEARTPPLGTASSTQAAQHLAELPPLPPSALQPAGAAQERPPAAPLGAEPPQPAPRAEPPAASDGADAEPPGAEPPEAPDSVAEPAAAPDGVAGGAGGAGEEASRLIERLKGLSRDGRPSRGRCQAGDGRAQSRRPHLRPRARGPAERWGHGALHPSVPGVGCTQACPDAEAMSLLSRKLAAVLRHKAPEWGVELQGREGWSRVGDLLRLRTWEPYTESDVAWAAHASLSHGKPRFELRSWQGEFWVRAIHKRTLEPPPRRAPWEAEDAARAAGEELATQAIAAAPGGAPDAAAGVAAGPHGAATPSTAATEGATDAAPDSWRQLGAEGPAPAGPASEGRCAFFEIGTPEQARPPDPWGSPVPAAAAESASAQQPDGPRPRCEEAVRAEAETASAPRPAAAGPSWTRYRCEPGEGYWWWCESTQEHFLEASPGAWCKYSDPASGSHYWWRDAGAWFYEATGGASPA